MGGRRGRRPKATARVSPAAEPQQTGGGALPRRAGETTPRADHRPEHDSDAIARIATADEDARPRDWTNDKLVDALVDAYVHVGRHGVMPPATALPVEVRSRLTSGLACAHPAHQSWIANLLECSGEGSSWIDGRNVQGEKFGRALGWSLRGATATGSKPESVIAEVVCGAHKLLGISLTSCQGTETVESTVIPGGGAATAPPPKIAAMHPLRDGETVVIHGLKNSPSTTAPRG